MAVDYVRHIQPREGDGVTDNQIAVKVSRLTVRDMPISEVKRLMRERNLWMKDPITGARDWGKIGAAMKDPSFPSGLYEGLVKLDSALYDSTATQISSHSRDDIAEDMSNLVNGLLIAGVVTQEDADAFYALGGGLLAPGLSGADVAVLRQAHIDQQARIAAYADIQRRTGAALSAAEAALHNQESPSEIEAAAQSAWES